MMITMIFVPQTCGKAQMRWCDAIRAQRCRHTKSDRDRSADKFGILSETKNEAVICYENRFLSALDYFLFPNALCSNYRRFSHKLHENFQWHIWTTQIINEPHIDCTSIKCNRVQTMKFKWKNIGSGRPLFHFPSFLIEYHWLMDHLRVIKKNSIP